MVIEFIHKYCNETGDKITLSEAVLLNEFYAAIIERLKEKGLSDVAIDFYFEVDNG